MSAKTIANGPKTRTLPSWIDSFLEYTKDFPTPELFRKWGAVTVLAGALERRVWTQPTHAPIYPNLYVLFTSEPGIGKSNVLGAVRDMLDATETKIAPTSMTKSSLVDVLRASSKSVLISQTQRYAYASLTISSSEFGVLMPAYDHAFMSVLTDLYDCPGRWEEQIRSRSLEEQPPILNSSLNIFAGTQPGYLASLLPDIAWSQGFMSRFIIVYAGNQPKIKLFASHQRDEKLRATMRRELKSLGNIYGEIKWSDEAGAALAAWYDAEMPPKPEHIRLQHYSARRLLHICKLSMIFALDRNSELIVELEDYQRALDLLLETEQAMPEVFKAMGSSDDRRVLDDLVLYVMREQARTNVPVPESRVVNFLAAQIPTHRIKTFMEVSLATGQLYKTDAGWKAKPKTKSS
jgi:hypothetical protein